MGHLDIVNTVAAAWKTAQDPSNGMARVGFQKAIEDADTWMKLADKAETGIAPVTLGQRPGTDSRAGAGLQQVPAVAELLQSPRTHVNGDAEGARELLVSIRREPYWSHGAGSSVNLARRRNFRGPP
jgi:hypothetical protein